MKAADHRDVLIPLFGVLHRDRKSCRQIQAYRDEFPIPTFPFGPHFRACLFSVLPFSEIELSRRLRLRHVMSQVQIKMLIRVKVSAGFRLRITFRPWDLRARRQVLETVPPGHLVQVMLKLLRDVSRGLSLRELLRPTSWRETQEEVCSQ